MVTGSANRIEAGEAAKQFATGEKIFERMVTRMSVPQNTLGRDQLTPSNGRVPPAEHQDESTGALYGGPQMLAFVF